MDAIPPEHAQAAGKAWMGIKTGARGDARHHLNTSCLTDGTQTSLCLMEIQLRWLPANIVLSDWKSVLPLAESVRESARAILDDTQGLAPVPDPTFVEAVKQYQEITSFYS
jgi:hypothetical protein